MTTLGTCHNVHTKRCKHCWMLAIATGHMPQPGWPPKSERAEQNHDSDALASWDSKDWDGVGAPKVPWYTR